MPEQLNINALTTLERVKEELGIDEENTNFDNALTRYINEASGFIQSYIGRNIAFTENHVEVLGGSSDNYLLLKNRPIVNVNSVLRDEEEIEDYLENPDDYSSGMLYRDAGWPKSSYITGLVGDFHGKRRNYTVNYDYGYVLPKDVTEENPQTLPSDIEGICIGLTCKKFKDTQRDNFGLKELKQGRITYKFRDSDLTTGDFLILKRYRRVTI